MNGEKTSSEETVKKFQKHQALYNKRFTERLPVAFVSAMDGPQDWPIYDPTSLEELTTAIADGRAWLASYKPSGLPAEMNKDIYILDDSSGHAGLDLHDAIGADVVHRITSIRKAKVLEVKPLTKPAPPSGFEYPSTEAIAKAAHAHAEYEKERAAEREQGKQARAENTSRVLTFTAAEYALLEEIVADGSQYAGGTLSPKVTAVLFNILAMGMERGDQTA